MKGDLRVILILSTVVLVIKVFSILLSMVLSLLAVDEIHSLCLGQLVYLCACEADEELLGELVGDWLSWDILEWCLEGSSTVWYDGGFDWEGKEEGRYMHTLLALSILENLEGSEGCGAC